MSQYIEIIVIKLQKTHTQ